MGRKCVSSKRRGTMGGYPAGAVGRALGVAEGYGRSATYTTYGGTETTLADGLVAMTREVERHWPRGAKVIQDVLDGLGP